MNKIPLVGLYDQYQDIKNEIDRAIESVITTSAFVGGDEVRQFEKEFAAYCETKACVGVGNGTDALYLTLRALGIGEGDEVITVAHTFIATSEAISNTGARAVFVDIKDDTMLMDAALLEQAITPRTRGVIVVHPNNPTGHFAKQAEIAQLNSICCARDLAIIADEVFLDFALDGSRAAGFAANCGAPTFTLSGLSKISGLPQMKAAWLVVSGPQEWKSEALARLEVIADTYLSVNAPVQLAMPRFLEERHGFQRQVMSRVRRNLAELDRQLAAQKAVSRLKVEGGWCAVLKVSTTRSDEDLAIELLTTQSVSVHPGHFYEFPAHGYLILSLIAPTANFSLGIVNVLTLLPVG